VPVSFLRKEVWGKIAGRIDAGDAS